MTRHRSFNIPLKQGVLALGPQPLLMGILNVTPDSFSDGGQHMDAPAALAHARKMLQEGADIIDVGGQSTRPGAEEISTQQELDRVIPVIEHLVASGVRTPISLDTFRAVVADQAIQAGASIINDVTGAQREPEIADVAALYKAPLILMHWDKKRNQDIDIILEITRYFDKSLSISQKAGIDTDSLILDPGFGFAKTLQENYQILNRLEELGELNLPLLVGMSRKSMLGKVLDLPTHELQPATLASSVIAYQKGAHIFRVHDVGANRQALQIAATCHYA